MASLKFSNLLESKNPNFIITSSAKSSSSGQCLLSSYTCYVHIANSPYIINPHCKKLNKTRVSQLDLVADSPNDCLSNESGDRVKGRRRNVWRRFRSMERVIRELDKRENETEGVSDFVKNDKNVNFDVEIGDSNLSTEMCNFILKRFERENDVKTMNFFERMRSEGKLKNNTTAYNLALRVVGRREDWDLAETMIEEMRDKSDCELNFQIFNTLIYACNKRGNVGLGSKWFHMMLKNGVRPNEATFGMLMSMYQKSGNLNEAEFAFTKMREFRVLCQSAYSAMITIYTRKGLYSEAEKVISFLRNDGVELNTENWLVLLNAYSQQGKLHEAEKVLSTMRELGFSPNIIAYNILITGYGKASKMTDAKRLFENLKSIGLEPDEATYRSMIEGWGRLKDYKEAKRYYRELKRANFEPNSSNLYTMINLQAEFGDIEGAVMTIKDMVKIGCHYPSILSILLQAYDRVEKVNKVPLVLKGDFYEHVLSNQTSCSILVMAYVKHSLVEYAIEVLRDIKWKDQDFVDNLYHLLICSCKDLGYLENAVKIYTYMPKSDDKPNLHITCTMIDVYCAKNQFEEAEKLYVKLSSSGVEFDMIAYSIIVRMFVKAGKLTEACSVLDAMDKQKDIIPDIYLLRDMLRVYQQCGKQEKLANLYYRILKYDYAWDQELYNCVINCCALALPVDELSKLFDEMLQRGFSPNTITINMMLNVYGKSGLFKKARKLFWVAKKRGLVDVVSYNTMIASYGQHKYLRNMSSTVREMQFHGFSVSLEAYNCMLDSYGKQGEMEKFGEVLRRMRETGCVSDHYTYNILINIYGENQWIEEVAGVLLELKESGLKPDLCSYNTLIKAYGIGGMVEDAVALVKEMRENGIEPDRVTYVNLITALRKNDKFLEAVKWSLWMKQMGL